MVCALWWQIHWMHSRHKALATSFYSTYYFTESSPSSSAQKPLLIVSYIPTFTHRRTFTNYAVSGFDTTWRGVLSDEEQQSWVELFVLIWKIYTALDSCLMHQRLFVKHVLLRHYFHFISSTLTALNAATNSPGPWLISVTLNRDGQLIL